MNHTEIRQYAERNNETGLTIEELDHVAICMEHIQKWYYEDFPLGGFLTAIVKNDLVGAVLKADDVNIKALKLYAYFLTWELPADWIIRDAENSFKAGMRKVVEYMGIYENELGFCEISNHIPYSGLTKMGFKEVKEMNYRKSVIEIRIRLDPIPGWGHEPEDHVKMLQDYLNNSILWYKPEVKLIKTVRERR